MKLKIIYKDSTSETVIMRTSCSTEELITQIENYEYNPLVLRVETTNLEEVTGLSSL